MAKKRDYIAAEIERLEGLRHDAAARYERSQNPNMLRRYRRFTILLQSLRQEYANLEVALA